MDIFEAQRRVVGGQIRKARKSAGLSHDKLAAMVGTSRQHLIALEKGDHVPREGMLRRIAEATGRPLSFFETEADAEDPVAEIERGVRGVVREELREDGIEAA